MTVIKASASAGVHVWNGVFSIVVILYVVIFAVVPHNLCTVIIITLINFSLIQCIFPMAIKLTLGALLPPTGWSGCGIGNETDILYLFIRIWYIYNLRVFKNVLGLPFQTSCCAEWFGPIHMLPCASGHDLKDNSPRFVPYNLLFISKTKLKLKGCFSR